MPGSTTQKIQVAILLALIGGSQAGVARDSAYYYLQSFLGNVYTEHFYWPDRHYISLSRAGDNDTLVFNDEDRIDLVALADVNGRPLQAGKVYRIDVPAKMPVKNYWSLTIYDRETFEFIRSNSGNTTVSSKDLRTMKKNLDGSVTFFIGPIVPKNLTSNWLTTMGKTPLPTFRFYGPTEALYKRTFKMPDLVPVNIIQSPAGRAPPIPK